MIPCPSCDRTWSNDVSLTSHLITTHGLDAPAAAARAQQARKDAEKQDRRVIKQGRGRALPSSPIPTKEEPMASNSKRNVTCHGCGATGHTKRSSECPKRGIPATEMGGKKRKPITRRHPLKPKKPATGTGLVTEIEALGAVAAALTPLNITSQANVLGCICKLLAIDPTKLAA